eukprot:TRINITY_DN1865_c0_g1_i1.p1 TRINITY_DN1865_c0_g1~~TRINITY_DN1865_c0_g1_i1.p1  ORF type:complete len:275 (+),score=66.21 TRINITY_DN1865_c0_g1_i1:94-918(+)
MLTYGFFFFFFSSRRRHTRCREVSWARRCVQETDAEYMGMRVNSNIPVVLIGETGCGKTYTIRYMCEHLKLGEPCPINIHSGLSAKNITDTVLEICKKANNHSSKQFWVFFDELNTNENIGVISAMMSDRIIEGKRVPKNIRFMAACNPFRLAKPNESSVIGFAPREDLSHKLEYRVFPLPETLTEYSWDIGEVDEKSGKRYIEEVVKRLMAELKIDNAKAVSYTHLTLPTILLVQISVVAVSLKKKKTYTPPASNGPYTRTHHITTPHIRPIY